MDSGTLRRALWPLVRLARTRPGGWELQLSIDTSGSMSVWGSTLSQFLAGLRYSGAFRRVPVVRLGTEATSPLEVTVRGPDDPGSPPVPAGSRGQAKLIITDGLAPAWRSGAVLPLIHEWASRHPVAVLHLQPPSRWHRTGVEAHRVLLRAAAVGVPNSRLAWQPRDPLPAEPLDSAVVPVPVLTMRPKWLAAWAQVITATPAGWVRSAALLATPEAPAADAVAHLAHADAGQLVREFISFATPPALSLATRLAAVPLHPRVLSTVQRQLMPHTDTTHVAELITGGLLRPGTTAAGGVPWAFEFPAGVRELLLAAGRRDETVRTWRALAQHLGDVMPDLARLAQVLDDPKGAPMPAADPTSLPLLRVELAVLRALSGPSYLDRARRLSTHLAEAGPAEARPPEGSPAEASPVPVAAPSGDYTTGSHSVTIEGSVSIKPTTDQGGEVSTIPAAAQAPASPQPQTTPARTPAIWGNIPPQNPNFTGRTSLLSELHEQVRSGTTAVLPHALHGMGGVGKSHLAIQYIYLHMSEYDLIWWISAERTAQVGNSMVHLAQRMGLATGPDVGTAREAVLEALRLGKPYERWLLIYDNAESPEALRQYLPSGGPGSIIITSRNPLWSSIASTLEVDVFAREESIQLLRRRGPDLDRDSADRLAEALGDLPLALEQAAAWRAETGMPADEYLRLFAETEQRMELLAQTTPMDYQLPVAAAWNVSLDRLLVSNPAAFRLLQVCAFLAPEPIPRALFGVAYNVDIHPELNAALAVPMRLNRSIRDITRYALVRINHRTNSIQMHRLVQAVLKDRMTPAEQESIRRSAHVLLSTGDRNDPDTPTNWASYAELYPHVDASGAVRSTDPRVQQLIQNEAKHLYWSGAYEEALDLCQRAYSSWRDQLGEDDPAVLGIGHRLGFMLFMLGRYKEAAEHNRAVLAGYQRTTDEDSEELLRQIGAVAADLRVSGNFTEALRLDEDLYQRHLRLLGEDDPNTLIAAHNLAVSLRLTGNLRKAFEVDQATHDHLVQLFGEEHSYTLDSRLNLIMDRRELGEYLAARNEMEEIVSRLGEAGNTTGQTQVLRARRRLAAAIRKAGDHEAARALSEELQSRYAGQEHPDALLATLGLAVDLRATGHRREAIELGETVHEQYRRMLGDQHPHTVTTSLNNAIAYRLEGDVELARRVNEAGVASLAASVGPDHPLALAASVNLANDLFAAGELAAAYACDTDTLDRLRRTLGHQHPTTLICEGNVAVDLRAQGRPEEASELQQHVGTLLREQLGPAHPATIAGSDLEVRGDCDLDPMPL